MIAIHLMRRGRGDEARDAELKLKSSTMMYSEGEDTTSSHRLVSLAQGLDRDLMASSP
jgi:hypothetical protein